MGVFWHCSVAPVVWPSRPIKSCRHLRAFPMSFSALFRHPSLIFTTNQILWAPTCNIYGRFSALFHRPFINIQWYATSLLIFTRNPDDYIDLGRPIGACRRDRVMSMDVFRQCESPLWIDMAPYGDYV